MYVYVSMYEKNENLRYASTEEEMESIKSRVNYDVSIISVLKHPQLHAFMELWKYLPQHAFMEL